MSFKSLFKYSAVNGKIHAMSGRRLTYSDFETLSEMQSVSDIASFLATHPSWGNTLADMPSDEVHRGILESAIASGLTTDYKKLLSFSFGIDKIILQAYCKNADVLEILSFLRLLGADHGEDYSCSRPEYFMNYGEINYKELMSNPTYDGLIEASKRSLFKDAIVRFTPKDNKIEYTKIETALRKCYFDNIYGLINSKLKMRESRELLNIIDIRIDYANIVNIYRAKKYFKSSSEELLGYILPYTGKLTQKNLNHLIEAKDEKEVIELLKSTSYAKDFESAFENIEDIFYKRYMKLNRKYLRSKTPGTFSAIAYFNLRELECKNLATTIECVRYGVEPKRTMELLIYN